MIIHSAEYYHALKAEMLDLQKIINSKLYGSDTCFLQQGIKQEIDVCDIALSNVNCIHCFHCNKDENRCLVNGVFPPQLSKENYSCPNWIFDDIPF